MKEVDVIIVGSGLAGTCLALHLLEAGKSISIIHHEGHSSTRVAAGLYNSITGRNMVKTWRADDLFPYLLKFYSDLESTSGVRFLNRSGIYRPFKSISEQNEWSGKSVEPGYQPFIDRIYAAKRLEPVIDDLGGVQLKQAGYLDTTTYLHAAHAMLAEYMDHQKFDSSKLQIQEDKVRYEDISARHLICCEGVAAVENPLFGWLPFSPVKGEVLEVEADMELTTIVNRGVFIIHREGNRFRVGSNYNNYDQTWTPTEAAREEITGKLNELINVPYKIVNQYAGVRPATRDRKPFIGMHPKFKNVGIFNGLGAKGVSLAPYFARHFTEHLVNQSALDKDVTIERYYSHYSDN